MNYHILLIESFLFDIDWFCDLLHCWELTVEGLLLMELRVVHLRQISVELVGGRGESFGDGAGGKEHNI